MTEAPVYEFADIRVDLRRMALSRGDQPVPLEPKTFDVLRLLLEHRDRLVSKDELLDIVWRDTFVTPNVLTRAIAQLRNAIGDDAQNPRYVETVAKRGYRLIAEVRVVGEERATVPPARIRRTRAAAVGGIAAIAAGLVVSGAGLWWTSRRPAPAVSAQTPQRLTIRTGNNTSPAVSPDGRAVAYISDRTGSLEIYVVGLAPGSREIAITSDGGQNMQPSWSSDGQRIAFHSRKRGGIWIVPSTGGTPRQIVDVGSEPAWAPDGRRLAYTSDEGGMASQSTLWIVDLDGSNRQPLTRIGHPPGGHRQPSWAHSGRFVTFSVGVGGIFAEIWMVSASGVDSPRRIVERAFGSPRFGPGDRALYWSGIAGPREANDRLWKLPIDPATAEPAGAPVVVLPLDDGRVDGVSVAGDGTLVFGLLTSDMNIWALDLAANGPTTKDPVRLTDDTVRSTRPEYSSTGRIAYHFGGPGRPFTTWLMDEDGRNREPLMADVQNEYPLWTRDGARLLIFSSVRDPGGRLWWVDAATRQMSPTPLTGRDRVQMKLSPDSRELAFHVVESNGILNVWTEPLSGGPRRRVTSDSEAVAYPAWSPDGRWLAVEIKRGASTHIGVVPRDGGSVEQLTNEPGQSWSYSWSPDGDQIAFAGEREGVWNVYSVSRRTASVRTLTRFTSSSGYVRYPAWSPRGNRIVFEREIRVGSVWTLRQP